MWEEGRVETPTPPPLKASEREGKAPRPPPCPPPAATNVSCLRERRHRDAVRVSSRSFSPPPSSFSSKGLPPEKLPARMPVRSNCGSPCPAPDWGAPNVCAREGEGTGSVRRVSYPSKKRRRLRRVSPNQAVR